MTALTINRKQLGFLRRIVKINFPSGHEWTASAQVSAIVFINIGAHRGALLSIAGFTLNTDTGPIYSTAQYPNPFTIPLNAQTGSNIGIDAWQSDVGFWYIASATMILNKVVLNPNPSVSVSGTFTATPVGPVSQVRVDASATGVTSGRPGGDSEQTATAPEVTSTSVVTITGSASASLHNVTAAVTAS